MATNHRGLTWPSSYGIKSRSLNAKEGTPRQQEFQDNLSTFVSLSFHQMKQLFSCDVFINNAASYDIHTAYIGHY